MGPKPINLTSKSTSEWILLNETKANFTNSCHGYCSQVVNLRKRLNFLISH